MLHATTPSCHYISMTTQRPSQLSHVLFYCGHGDDLITKARLGLLGVVGGQAACRTLTLAAVPNQCPPTPLKTKKVFESPAPTATVRARALEGVQMVSLLPSAGLARHIRRSLGLSSRAQEAEVGRLGGKGSATAKALKRRAPEACHHHQQLEKAQKPAKLATTLLSGFLGAGERLRPPVSCNNNAQE